VPARRCLSTAAPKPTVKPECAQFSSGPCKKRPGYTVAGLAGAVLGRSHRHKVGKDKLAGAINGTRELLEPVGLPKDYHIGIVPASDTGAVEMAMWSLLGPKPVTCVHFESFGGDWHTDITKQLKLKDVTNMQVGIAASPHELPRSPASAPSSHALYPLPTLCTPASLPNLCTLGPTPPHPPPWPFSLATPLPPLGPRLSAPPSLHPHACQGDYGVLPDFSKIDFDQDVIFTANGTTSGVRVPADVNIPCAAAPVPTHDSSAATLSRHALPHSRPRPPPAAQATHWEGGINQRARPPQPD